MNARLFLAAVAVALIPPIALAQDAQPTGGQAQTSSAVTVTGARPTYQHQIDKKSYALTADPLLTNESIGEALKNIPSVDVDPNGTLSVRGDSDVTVLVDGQPSPLFQGPIRAQALQSLPADQYERVEVITNPSAAYSSEGTGGVINLITKKSHVASPSGEVNAGVSTMGATYHAGLNGALPINQKLTLSGAINVRGESNYKTGTQVRERIIDPNSGDTATITNDSDGKFALSSTRIASEVDYQADADTRLSGSFNYSLFHTETDQAATYRSSATSGPLAVGYDVDGRTPSGSSLGSSSFSYVRQLGGQDHQFSLVSSYTFAWRQADGETLTDDLSPAPNFYEDQIFNRTLYQANVKAEYKGPLPGGASLDTGYMVTFDDNTDRNTALLGESAANASPDLVGRFRFDQTVNALFATVDQPLGAFDIKPGLRLEEAVVDTDYSTTNSAVDAQYFTAYPSLSVLYKIDKDTSLSASYTRKVDRPADQQMDPYLFENNPLSFTQGNQHLKPSFTDSYELDYDINKGKNYYDFDFYYKNTQDMISSITENLGGGALLDALENVGERQSVGGELIVNQQLSKTLSLTLTADASWDRVSSFDGGPPPYRSGVEAWAIANLKWSPTRNDFLQIKQYVVGAQITPEGHQDDYVYTDIGYRHQFPNRWSLELEVLNPFDTVRFVQVVDTPTLNTRSVAHPLIRFLSVGFTYPLGGGGPKPVQRDFDFGSNNVAR